MQIKGFNSNIPVVEKISQNGQYNVELRFVQTTLLPNQGIEFQVVFLEPDVQDNLSQLPLESSETNRTSASTINSSGYTDLSVIEAFKLVESYDITVFSDSGNVLWQQIDQPGFGGRSHNRILFEEPYSGPVTILINDIRLSSAITPDSVSFSNFKVQ